MSVEKIARRDISNHLSEIGVRFDMSYLFSKESRRLNRELGLHKTNKNGKVKRIVRSNENGDRDSS
jgi:hypothetical protein